ncbi:TPA: hypothetical protein ACH3X2_002945 [Trebouxia sp. C0005]
MHLSSFSVDCASSIAACLDALLEVLQRSKQWQHAVKAQPDTAAYATVLAALLEAGQVQASFSVVGEMRGQGWLVEAGSCNHLLVQLLSSNELGAAIQIIQDMLAHSQSPDQQICVHLVHLLKDGGQVWAALKLIKHIHQAVPSIKLRLQDYVSLTEKALS